MNSTQEFSTRSQVGLVLGVSFLTVICAIWLLFLPNDSNDRLIIGFSIKHWLMLASFAVPGLILASLFTFALRKISLQRRLQAVLLSDWFSWLALITGSILAILFLWTVIDIPRNIIAYLVASQPVIFWYGAVITLMIIFHCRVRKAFQPMPSRYFYLWGVLFFSISLILWNTFRYRFPLGYAGLFTLMADLLGANHYLPSLQVPFYGPGGIPFAYPPLGPFIMAFVTQATGLGNLDYLRFMPALFLIGACLAMAVLARQLTRSALAGFLAGVFLASSPSSIFAHGQAAGMVRGLALAMVLVGLIFFDKSISEGKRKAALFSGLCFGLVLVTHLAYALFFGLSVLCWALVPSSGGSKPLRWRIELGAIVAITGLALSGLWWKWVIDSYGWSVLGNILFSHNNLSILDLFTKPFETFNIIQVTFRQVGENPLLVGGGLIGVAFLLAQREFRLPIWFTLIVLMNPSEDRFIFMICCILTAIVVVSLLNSGKAFMSQIHQQPETKWLLVGLVVAFTWVLAWLGLRSQSPVLSPELIQLGKWFEANTPQESKVLLIPDTPDEAEWFPYFLRRNPVIGSWGAEWNGTYADQLVKVYETLECGKQGSLSCVQNLMPTPKDSSLYLVTREDQMDLCEALRHSTDWKELYKNQSYRVWKTSGMP